jgi:antitoxin component YwqK of YwqJK toxin-antitoxin module
MNKNKTSRKLYVITFAVLIVFLCTFCAEEYIPETNLEMRDTLIYKKGNDVPFTGREKAKIKDKIIEYDIVSGVRQGEFLIYYENGNIEIKGQMDNNINVGKWQYFYESSEIESEGNFVNNQPEGKWVWYFRSGELKEEGNFKLGRRVGKWRNFDVNGNVIHEKEFSFDDTTNVTEKFFDQFNQNK